MAQDLNGLINQLKVNNDAENERDARRIKQATAHNQDQLRGIDALAATLSKNNEMIIQAEIQAKNDKAKEEEEAKETKAFSAQVLSFLGFQQDLSKKKEGLASANEEKENRMMRVFNALGDGIKGLDKKFGSFAKSFTDSIKSKVKSGLGAMLDVFKKFAMVGALAALLAFLNSDMFKNLKKDYIDPLTESFKTLIEKFSNIGQTFEDIKAGFFNEKGEFIPIAGIKNTLTEISELFDGTGAALMTIGGLTLFAFRKRVIRLAKGLGARLLSISGITNVFGNNLDTVDKDMRDRNTRAKNRGIFSKGFRGIGKRFGRLFLRMGAFGALIGGASLLMGDRLKEAGGVKGVFAGIKNKFGQLFGKIGQLGSKIAGVAKDMGTKVTTAVTEGVLSAKGKIMSGFNSMFDALGNLGKGIKDLAGKAAGKVTSTLKGADADIDPKKKTQAQIDADKKAVAKRRQQMDMFRNADKKSLTELDKFQKAKKIADQAAAAKRAKDMRMFRAADALSMKNFNLGKKAAAETAESVVEKGTKQATGEIAEKAVKKGFMIGLKKTPFFIGAAVSTGFAIDRLLKGDYVGAGIEFGAGVASIFPGPGTAASLAGEGALIAHDITKNKNAIVPEQSAADGSGIQPYQDAIMRMAPSVTVNKGGDTVRGGDQTINLVPFTDSRNAGMRSNLRYGTPF